MLNEYVTFKRVADNEVFDSLLTYGLILAEKEYDSPEVVTYQSEIPGRSGYLDLTESLTGDVVYQNYDIEYTFLAVSQSDKKEYFEALATSIMNDLHGRKLYFRPSWDKDYIYTGRAEVEFSTSKYRLDVTITLDTLPYKSKGTQLYTLNATGGKLFRLESGRKPVRPYIECDQPCIIAWEGQEIVVGAGSWRLNDVLFTEGWNEIYINSFRFWNIVWAEVGESGKHALTYDEAHGKRWDDLQRLGGDVQDVPQMWEEVRFQTWGAVESEHWYDLDYRNENVPDTTVKLLFEWEDL
jgi:hypothetical protein